MKEYDSYGNTMKKLYNQLGIPSCHTGQYRMSTDSMV